MSIGEELRTELVSVIDSTRGVSSNVFQNKVPKQLRKNYPRVWYMRNNETNDLTLDAAGGLRDASFDLEIHGEDIDVVLAIADDIKSTSGGLHGRRGQFGAAAVKGVFVSDQDDNYVPKGTGDDKGLHVAALEVRILHST